MTRQGTTSQSQVGHSNHKAFELVNMWKRTCVFFFQSFFLTQSQQSNLLKQQPPWKVNLEFLQLPFSKSVAVRVCLLTYVHQCTYYRNDGHLGKGRHLEFFISHPIYPKSGLIRVYVAYFLYHIWKQWPFLSVDCTLPWWGGLCTPMNMRAMPAWILYPWQV